ncbi:DUF3068 domain-containing protein [Aeromicrobium sp. NPDC092404]|uniref:DUF3068 domain-containing protein n=1 Tax=Aeromicrobium sp. NPDC092404 TaxID=3154976 RepID=UPI00342ACF47
MSKKLGTVALFLGAFLLALAALSKFYMYDELAVVPLNNESTSVAETAAGKDAEYLDVAAGLKPTTGPLKNTKVVVGNVEEGKKASEELDRDIAVWDIYDCTDKPSFDCGSGETALSATDDRVAFDRTSGEAVDWEGARSDVDGEIIEPGKFEGLYFKFPFDAKKKTYPFWDGTLREATPAKFVGEGKVKGMKTYTYEQTIEPIKTGTIDVPGSLVGSDETTVTADRIYSSVSTYEVEPVTGVVLVGQTAQDSYLELDGERVLTTTKATLRYTEDNIASTVDEYKSKALLLSAVKTYVPLGGGALGLALIVLGLFTRRGSREGARASHKGELVSH